MKRQALLSCLGHQQPAGCSQHNNIADIEAYLCVLEATHHIARRHVTSQSYIRAKIARVIGLECCMPIGHTDNELDVQLNLTHAGS